MALCSNNLYNVTENGLYNVIINGKTILNIMENIHSKEDMSFRYACMKNDIEECKILTYHDVDLSIGFKLACVNGHLDICHYILEVDALNSIDIKDDIILFYQACLYGNLEMAKWLYENQSNINIFEAFRCACSTGQINICKWLYNIDNTIVKNPSFCTLFKFVCNKGNKIYEWLYEIGINEISTTIMNEIFSIACSNGYINVIKWLYTKCTIYNIEQNFTKACEAGHLSICEWLYETFKINIRAKHDFIFRQTCQAGQLKIAQWIMKVEPYTKFYIGNDGIRFACLKGHLDLAKWLYELYILLENDRKNDNFICNLIYKSEYNELYSDIDEIFQQSFMSGKLNICQWLIKLKPNLKTVGRWCRHNHSTIMQMLAIKID
jgi:hypothetical protein